MTRQEFLYEVKDYVNITLGLLLYTFGFTLFLLPYQIVTGGISGIGAIVFYSTGFPVQYTFFIINAVLIVLALKILLEVFDKDHLRHLHADIVLGDFPRHYHHAQWRVLQDSGGEQ